MNKTVATVVRLDSEVPIATVVEEYVVEESFKIVDIEPILIEDLDIEKINFRINKYPTTIIPTMEGVPHQLFFKFPLMDTPFGISSYENMYYSLSLKTNKSIENSVVLFEDKMLHYIANKSEHIFRKKVDFETLKNNCYNSITINNKQNDHREKFNHISFKYKKGFKPTNKKCHQANIVASFSCSAKESIDGIKLWMVWRIKKVDYVEFKLEE